MVGKAEITIDFNGNPITLRFNTTANRMFAEKLLQNPESYTTEGVCNEIGVAYLLYTGYLSHCLINQLEHSISFGEFIDYVDRLIVTNDPILGAIAKCYQDSEYTHAFIKNVSTINLDTMVITRSENAF